MSTLIYNQSHDQLPVIFFFRESKLVMFKSMLSVLELNFLVIHCNCNLCYRNRRDQRTQDSDSMFSSKRCIAWFHEYTSKIIYLHHTKTSIIESDVYHM